MPSPNTHRVCRACYEAHRVANGWRAEPYSVSGARAAPCCYCSTLQPEGAPGIYVRAPASEVPCGGLGPLHHREEASA